MNRLFSFFGLNREPTSDIFNGASPDNYATYQVEEDDDVDDEDDGDDDGEFIPGQDEEEDLVGATSLEENSGHFEYQLKENGLYFLRDIRRADEVWLLASSNHSVVQFCFALHKLQNDVVKEVMETPALDVEALRQSGGLVPGLLGFFVEEKLSSDANFFVPGCEGLPAVEQYLTEDEQHDGQSISRFTSKADAQYEVRPQSMHMRRYFVSKTSEERDGGVVQVSADTQKTSVIWYTLDPNYYALYRAYNEHMLQSACILKHLSSTSFTFPEHPTKEQAIEHIRSKWLAKDNPVFEYVKGLERLKHSVSVAVANKEIESTEVLRSFAHVESAINAMNK
jgi:hypothetical protein